MKERSRLPKLFIPLYGKEKLNEAKIKVEDVEEKDLIYESANVDVMVYIRDNSNGIGKKGKPIGVIIIYGNYCGWSLCHDNDEWDKLLGIYKAICKLGSKKNIKEVKDSLLDKKINDKSMKNNKKFIMKMGYLFATLQYIESKMKERKNYLKTPF